MKNRTKLIRCGIIILLLIAVVLTALYFKSSNTYEPFINQVSETNSELIDENGQSVTIDAYTITLERTLYDKDTGLGYLAFAITKKDGRPEADINKWHQANGDYFGKNKRFCLNINCSSDSTFGYKDKTLYEYIFFESDEPSELDLTLIDTEEYIKSSDSYKSYSFTVKDSVDTIAFKLDESSILTISGLGIAIFTDKSIPNTNIILHYKDGKEENVVDTERGVGIGSSGEYSTDNSEYKYTYVFQTIKNITDIDYVVFNNETYYPS